MEQRPTKKLTIDFPADEFVYLKMACAKQDISIKDFVTRAVIRSIENYEDELDKLSIEQAYKDIAEHGTISWEQACKELGWDA